MTEGDIAGTTRWKRSKGFVSQDPAIRMNPEEGVVCDESNQEGVIAMSGQFNTMKFLQTITAQMRTLFQAQFDKLELQLEQQGQRLDALTPTANLQDQAGERDLVATEAKNQELLDRVEELEQLVIDDP
ncbi:unnamed protein product [Linum trigynum]|uniref:Uncharacterized protein n=1 Tax=Linum trigynum TaxID=586398 RepID=A0AAV2E6Y7_9ROSI